MPSLCSHDSLVPAVATWPPCSALENGSEAPVTKGTPTTSAPGATGTWAWRGAAHWILPKAANCRLGGPKSTSISVERRIIPDRIINREKTNKQKFLKPKNKWVTETKEVSIPGISQSETPLLNHTSNGKKDKGSQPTHMFFPVFCLVIQQHQSVSPSLPALPPI